MRTPRIALFVCLLLLYLLTATGQFCGVVISGAASVLAYGQGRQSGGPANPAQGGSTTTRTNNPDGSTTITTTIPYKDGSTTTETTYDKDGHDAGTVRTDVQIKDGETTTTITRYDGNGHEIGKTITRVDKDGNSTVTNYDANGQRTDTTILPPFKYKLDFKLGLDYNVPPELRHLNLNSETQNSANPKPGPPGTTRVTSPDGTTTITTVTIYKDGWTITITKYDRDGHDAGTTRTDVQTKDGQTTTTTTKWDGNGHMTGQTIERGEQQGSKTIITFDGSGHETGRTMVRKAEVSGGNSALDQLPDEVKKSLNLALEGREQRLNSFREGSPGTTHENQNTTPTTVTLVLPAQASGMISGMVLTEKDHPERFKDLPGIQVLELGRPPMPTGNDGNPLLDSLVVDTGNHVWQPANRPILFQSNPEEMEQTITLAARDNSSAGVVNQHTVNIHRALAPFIADDQYRMNGTPARIGVIQQNAALRQADTANSGSRMPQYLASPVSLPGIADVHGPLSGNIAQMAVAIGNQNVFPFAANQSVAFYTIPPDIPPGPTQVTFVDGTRVATWTTVVLKMATGVDQPALHKGGKTDGHIRLETGPLNSNQKMWMDSNFRMRMPSYIDEESLKRVNKIEPLALENRFDPDLLDLNKLQKSFPNFNPQANGGDFVFVGIHNLSPTISIEGGPVQFFSVPMQSLPVDKVLKFKATADGPFDVQVVAQLFAAPRACQEYQLPLVLPRVTVNGNANGPAQNPAQSSPPGPNAETPGKSPLQ